jgi:hypothetical protein
MVQVDVLGTSLDLYLLALLPFPLLRMFSIPSSCIFPFCPNNLFSVTYYSTSPFPLSPLLFYGLDKILF